MLGLGGQQAGPAQVVEGREDLAVGEVAGGAEDDHDGGVGHPLEARAGAQRVGRGRVLDRVAMHHVPGTTVAAGAPLVLDWQASCWPSPSAPTSP